jgi:hypothetical protein
MIVVSYQDKRGASCTRSFDDKVAVVAFIARLRCEATITEDGKKIGEVYYLPDATKRRKWGWWIEAERAARARMEEL